MYSEEELGDLVGVIKRLKKIEERQVVLENEFVKIKQSHKLNKFGDFLKTFMAPNSISDGVWATIFFIILVISSLLALIIVATHPGMISPK